MSNRSLFLSSFTENQLYYILNCKMFLKIFHLTVLLMIVVNAQARRLGRYDSFESAEPARYNFDWAVRDQYSGNNFGHQESRNDDNTKGAYYVLLPDGRTQKITYYVDGDSGFVADVTYDGQPSVAAQSRRYQKAQPPRPRFG